jgi:WD40 repeat protein
MEHDHAVVGALLTKDEKYILSRSRSTLRLWDASTGLQFGPELEADGLVRGALLTTDDTRILSWSGLGNDIAKFSGTNSVQLWDMATRRQIGPTMRHQDIVIGAILNRLGDRVLSWSQDNTLRQWEVPWQGKNLLEIACNLFSPDDLTSVSKRYGVNIADPVCQPGKSIPMPDWSSVGATLKN